METGTPFRKVMMEQDEITQVIAVKELLNQSYIERTNAGFRINVIKLVDTLTKKQKEDLQTYLFLKSTPTVNK